MYSKGGQASQFLLPIVFDSPRGPADVFRPDSSITYVDDRGFKHKFSLTVGAGVEGVTGR